MCATKSVQFFALLVLMTSYALCAPVADIAKDAAEIAQSADDANTNQDKDLTDLMNLVNQQTNRQNVMVHKQSKTHFENDNGRTTEVKEEEEKVLDTKTGDVIADVQQEVKQESSSDGQEPETVVETKVDIPAEGVHETVVQTNPEARNQEESVPSKGELMDDLSPTDMADFLYSTQQFDLFDHALNKLVNQSKMTAEEAEEYARVVALEYERIQMEEPIFDDVMMDGPVMSQRSMPQEPSLPYDNNFPPEGPMEYAPAQWPAQYPAQYPLAPGEFASEAFMTPEEKYLALLQQQQQQQQQQQMMADEEISPYDFLSALWDEAYGKGNVEAQAIVQMLYDRVSSDEDSDDMGQIRDILVDSLATSLNESPEMPEAMDFPAQENIEVPAAVENAAEAQEEEEEEVQEEEAEKELEEEEEEEKEEEKTEEEQTEQKEEQEEEVKEEQKEGETEAKAQS